MKIKLPKLHNQILLALILGAIFGSIFNVDNNKLILTYKEYNNEISLSINNWDTIIFISEKDSIVYGTDNQLDIIYHFRKLKKEKQVFSIIIKNFFVEDRSIESRKLTDLISIEKETTIATGIKFFGDIFIRLLNMIAIPLVLSSLIVGAASLGDIRRVARIGGKTITYYLVTTSLAITIGVVLANVIQPGNQMSVETKERLMSVYQEDAAQKIETELDIDLIEQIVNIVPRNPFDALAKADMLQIVFFALMVGIILTLVRKEKAEPVLNFFDGLSDAMIRMVDLIMLYAPIGVFALIAATVGEFGFDILETLIWYSLTVILGLALQTFGVYALLIKSLSKMEISFFYKGLEKVFPIAFSTSSSAATLPINMESCQDNLGVSKKITSFVLPLGATINMDGTALYQGVAAVFIAQVYGFDLNLGQQLTIVLTATLASIGTAPVPGVGIIMLIIVLRAIGIPQEGIGLILGVDRILDMMRTVTNVTGDASATVIIASSEKEINIPIIKKE